MDRSLKSAVAGYQSTRDKLGNLDPATGKREDSGLNAWVKFAEESKAHPLPDKSFLRKILPVCHLDSPKKIGLNLKLADKSLAVTFDKPWNLLADFNSDSTHTSTRTGEICEKSKWRRE